MATGRLSEYDEIERQRIVNPRREYPIARQISTRDEYLTSAYIAGRNHARDGKDRRCPDEYINDSLAAVNWEVGYDDVMSELAYERSINQHD